MNFDKLRKIYFLGIGGIGMSAIARYFLSRGKEIHGYDLTKTILTKKLEDEGMHIHYDIDVEKIPEGIELVVFTPAIPQDHAELKWFRDKGYRIMKRAEVLGLLSRAHRTIAVAGTHGKTTTSSFVTHILKYCGREVTAFLGGILTGYDTNFFYGVNGLTVLEADEYDRSFLQLSPDVLLIISMDADHLDIYNDVQEMYRAYEELTRRIKPGGKLILACEADGKFSPGWKAQLSKNGVELRELSVEFGFSDIEIEQSLYRFEFRNEKTRMKLESGLAGRHNVLNTCLAVEIALGEGVDEACVRKGCRSFEGIKRRFETLHKGSKILIDDYAHHPNELKMAVQTALEMYPGKKVLGVFQPHLYSRTRDFYREFAQALEKLDEIWLMPVYPAREKPMEGVQTELIYNLIRNDNKRMIRGESLAEEIRKKDDFDVLLTLGASDIDKYHEELIEVLKNK